MVDYKYGHLFWKRSIDKQLKIATDDGLFTALNDDIHWEDFELTESLCSDSELHFGSCEASMVKFQIRNAFIPLAGKWLTVSDTLAGNTDAPFVYGRYKVFSDRLTADKEYRDIVAYDVMYDIINTDVAAWYNSVLHNKNSTVTLKQFRESFLRHFGLAEVLPKIGETASGTPIFGLVNDGMAVERTIDPEQISGKDVITAICELNGCFGHIGRDGKFHYIYLQQDIQGLYPADFLYPDHVPEEWNYLSQAETGHLYPQDPKGEKIGKRRYIKCQYEDYVVRTINKLQIRKEENDIGVIYGNGDNCYVIQDNFLVYGKSNAELNVIAQNIYNKIRGIIYRPFNAECPGNPCLEVGDAIHVQTEYNVVESYILKRTLKGIQGLRDNYSSIGLEKRSENVNSVQKSIMQLKGKTNTLTRTVEENRLEVKDIERKLQSEILQNANEIALRVRKDNVIASINLSPEAITLQANRIDLKGLVNADELVSKFATISTLNATSASLQNLISQKAAITDLNATNAEIENLKISKLSVSDFTAENISAMNITVKSANVTGGFNANKITSGTISADRIDAGTIAAKLGNFSGIVTVPRLFVNEAEDAHLIRTSTLQLGIASGTRLTTSCHWSTITIENNSYTVLCQ